MTNTVATAAGIRESFGRAFEPLAPARVGAPRVVVSLLESPVGPLVAGATDGGIRLLEFSDPERLKRQASALRRVFGEPAVAGTHPHLETLRTELDEYFAGRRQVFSVPLEVAGTPFQLRVWERLRAIPYGQTRSYESLAVALGQPRAIRAVGLANGSNPLAILVPCHRVIGKDGRLVGYGGGLDRKRQLLDLEQGRRRLW